MQFAIDGTTKIDKALRYDAVIIGAGLAGLYTALNIDERYSCLILAKEKIEISNSWFAQGGIAAAISQDDAPIFHLEDTLIAGAGLCDKDAVGILVDGRTELWVRRAGRLVPASAEDIRPADTVRVWHDGVELRSLPPQYHATRIVVIHAP